MPRGSRTPRRGSLWPESDLVQPVRGAIVRAMYSTELATFFIVLLVAAVVLAVLFAIIKTAVKSALRDHQLWIDAGKPDPDAPSSSSSEI